MIRILAMLVLLGGVGSSYAVTNIFDNFNDGVIDTTKWQVLLPFGN